MNGTLYIKTAVRNKRRIINLEEIKNKMAEKYQNNKNVSEVFDALVFYHAFTGCDLSCFHWM